MRTNTGITHPLFMGNYQTYFADQRWRADIPKATSEGMISGWIKRQRQTAPQSHTRTRRISEKEGDY